jgi:uncharacterized membrane protein YidH (DUF202 family)
MTTAPGCHGPALPGRSEPSDKGLAGERTMLAWARVGLGLLGLPSAVLGYAAGHDVAAGTAAAVAAVFGLAQLILATRRQRVAPGGIANGTILVAAGQILLTAGCVLTLALACLALVLT